MAKAKTSSLLGFLSSSRTVCSFNSFVKRKGNGIGYKDRAKNPTDVERKKQINQIKRMLWRRMLSFVRSQAAVFRSKT
jgi:hypothetical protein